MELCKKSSKTIRSIFRTDVKEIKKEDAVYTELSITLLVT